MSYLKLNKWLHFLQFTLLSVFPIQLMIPQFTVLPKLETLQSFLIAFPVSPFAPIANLLSGSNPFPLLYFSRALQALSFLILPLIATVTVMYLKCISDHIVPLLKILKCFPNVLGINSIIYKSIKVLHNFVSAPLQRHRPLLLESYSSAA